MPPVDQIPRRKRQAPPTDPLQNQVRLLTQAVQTPADAVIDFGAHREGAAPPTRAADHALALTRQVATLGGWAPSLLPVGVPLRDGDSWVVLE